MIDVVINIDSLHLKDDETIDDVIDYIGERWDFGYEPCVEVLYEEIVDD
ncbi:MAG: hypothetical protein J6Y78_04510 [Paludibacteraceae bacterium]|nr:hypothetical protein [Paludibacteraceae bacterium]